MIRINLLPQEKGKAKRRTEPAGGDVSQKITVASTLILVLAGLGVAWWYWSLHKESARLAEDVAAAQQETVRLRAIIVEVQRYERRRTQLQERVTLIEQLRKGQSAPVHMLDELSRSLPDSLWLTEVEQKGSELTIEGRCSALTFLSDFVTNLEQSGWFKKPVEIVDSQVERTSGADVDLIRFTIKAQFAPPG
jgi:type IV pilus assembly protein PilN